MDWRWLEFIAKPIILVSLILLVLIQTKSTVSAEKSLLLGALIFSWAGDVLLMFQPYNELFFLLGLSAFLIAHIFYISYFLRIRRNERLPLFGWPFILVGAYYVLLIVLLTPHLREMKIPVWIYGLVISAMMAMALHMRYLHDRRPGSQLLLGAALFVVSDSLLAINKFYQTFSFAGGFVILTYGLAQIFMVKGAIQHLSSGHKE
jgi:uncharacterized membrane protein YhhN